MAGLVNNRTVLATSGIIPDRIWVRSDRSLSANRTMAWQAVRLGRSLVPKLSGTAAKGMTAYWTAGSFGIRWSQTYVWFQEAGIRPFTMTRLAGKTIPMWIDDPTGIEARRNPRARRRVTVSGRRQILIFRKAARVGDRKRVARRNSQGQILGWRDVPASYPGAPGRIAHREYRAPSGTTGRISRPNVGVRWRHPGLEGRAMLQHAVLQTAVSNGIPAQSAYATLGRR